MDFERSEEQELLAESVTRFLAERAPISHYVRERLDDDHGTTAKVWEALSELGVVGLLAPEAAGGAGMGMVDAAVVLESMGRFVHPGPYVASAIGAVSIVTLAGSDADRDAFLPQLACGATIGTVALWEPGRSARWDEPETLAVADGDAWRLDGTKAHVPDAIGADVIFVVARLPHGVVGVFRVTPETQGVTVTATPTVDGTRKEATVELVNAEASMLGTGDAMAAVAETIDRLPTAM